MYGEAAMSVTPFARNSRNTRTPSRSADCRSVRSMTGRPGTPAQLRCFLAGQAAVDFHRRPRRWTAPSPQRTQSIRESRDTRASGRARSCNQAQTPCQVPPGASASTERRTYMKARSPSDATPERLGATSVQVVTMLDPYLSLRALAGYSGLSVRSLRACIADLADPLPCYRVGGKILVRVSEYDGWKARRRYAPRQTVREIVNELMGPREPGAAGVRGGRRRRRETSHPAHPARQTPEG